MSLRPLLSASLVFAVALACSGKPPEPAETPAAPSAAAGTPETSSATQAAEAAPSAAAPAAEASAAPSAAPESAPAEPAGAKAGGKAAQGTTAKTSDKSSSQSEYTGDDPCQTKNFHYGAVKAACHAGGRPQAKGVMKAAVQKAKAAGEDVRCTSCHEDTKSFTLKSNAVADLKKWL